jgi:hypothetical protein
MTVYYLYTGNEFIDKRDCKNISFPEAKLRFPRTDNLAPGFWTIHPLDKAALVPLQGYFSNLALDKENECILLLGKMGAKNVHIKKIDKNSFSNKTEVDTKVPVYFTANGKLSVSNNTSSLNEYTATFQGNHDNFDKNLLQNSIWFKNDSSLQAVLEGRLSKNKMTHYKITTESIQSYNFDFSLAARILEGVVSVDIKNEFKKESEIKREFEVEFPD